MLYCHRIDLSKGIDPAKSTDSKECIVCHYWLFNYGFKFQNSVCNGCHVSDIVIITVKGVDYHCIIHSISKSESIYLIENSVLNDRGCIQNACQRINIKNRVYNYYFGNLVKTKKLETTNILTDKKKYRDSVIYFTRCSQ